MTGSVGGQEGDRPSTARRKYLRDTDCSTTPTLSNLFPIDRYYNAADRVLEAYDKSMSRKDLDDAYVFGMRFATFATKAIPTHDYYNSPKPDYVRRKAKLHDDLGRVIGELEEVADLMDAEELERRKREEIERKRRWEAEQKRRAEEVEKKRREEAERKKREKILATAEARRRAMEAGVEYVEPEDEDGDDAGGGGGGGKVNLMDRLDLLNDLFPKTPSGVGAAQQNADLPPAPPDAADVSQLFADVDDDKPSSPPAESLPIGSDLPLPLPVPLPPPPAASDGGGGASAPPPPSYSAVVVDKQSGIEDAAATTLPPPPAYYAVVGHSMNGGAAAAAGGMPRREDSGPYVSPHAPADWSVRQSVEPAKPPRASKELVSLRKLRERYTTEYQRLLKKKQAEVFLLNTYQGRLSLPSRDSTNGCTVISPLVAAQHLKSEGAGIADEAIERVIDDVAPPILRAIRSKLGLGGAALIIPSDVHDYLVDRKILRQETFVGVCGGNILDSEHLGTLLGMLQNGDEKKDHGRKKIAAAFFFHEHVMCIVKVVLSNGVTWFDIVDSLPHPSSRGNGGPARASRTRCKDTESLETTLKWYACSKFGETDRTYIDNNLWDDVMCDFDPRVFQAFVWAAD